MQIYQQYLRDILQNGRYKQDRTGTGCYSLYGPQYVYDLRKGLPVMTLRKFSPNASIHELIGFIAGKTNLRDPVFAGIKIWDEWALKECCVTPQGVELLPGEIGPMYGHKWRSFGGVDQLRELVDNLRNRPNSRRHVVTAWDPTLLPDESISPEENVMLGRGALAECHCFFQCFPYELTLEERCAISPMSYSDYFRPDGDDAFPGAPERLQALLARYDVPTYGMDLKLYQRSNDAVVGAPSNIAQYAVLLHLLCHDLNYAVGNFIHSLGDAHIYSNHLQQARELIDRAPKGLSKIGIRAPKRTSIFDIRFEDIVIITPEQHPALKCPISK